MKYTTQLNPKDVREILSGNVSAKIKGGFQSFLAEKKKPFDGIMTDSSFSLSIKPKGKASVPTLVGAIKPHANGSLLDIQVSSRLMNILVYGIGVVFCTTAFAGLALGQGWGQSVAFLGLATVMILNHHRQLKNYKQESLALLTALLELKPIIEQGNGEVREKAGGKG
jgi:hypothetical protein